MSKPNGSPPSEASPSSIGPVGLTFSHFGTQFVSMETVQARLVWYMASLQMYNTMVELMRATDPNVMSMVTAAIKHDLDTFFAEQTRTH